MAEERVPKPRLIYPLRVGGMGLGALVAMSVLYERQADPVVWALVCLGGFVWPHLAYLAAQRSRAPERAETWNLLIDSAILGAFVPMMQFNLLPSVLMLTLTTLDKISAGGWTLWLRSLPGMVLAGAVSWWWMDKPMVPESSMLVVLACMPVLFLHSLSISLTNDRLLRRIMRQNKLLDELRRVDPLTGLYGRMHWEQQALEVLGQGAAAGERACLVMLDIDGFKQINDRWGHTVGDDVICAVSHIVRGCVRASDCAGRYGGDEFAIVLRGARIEQAQEIAQRICVEAENHRFREQSELRFTISIGIAALQPHYATPRDWIAAADAALYEAKRAGRNRVELRAISRVAPLTV
jgi:diguanylate cyclase